MALYSSSEIAPVARNVSSSCSRCAVVGSGGAAYGAAGAAAAAAAAPYVAPPEATTAQRLQELKTLRATGTISDDEYNAKRQQILSDL